MIWFADIGAYVCGKEFGKNKLAKNISPGKTIEGAIGGFLSNVIFVFILSQFYVLISNAFSFCHIGYGFKYLW